MKNIRNVMQVHIHLGAEGEDGLVVVWLYPEEEMELELIEGSFSGTLVEGTITEDDFVGEWEDVDFEDAIATFEEGGAYVNVRTEEHPRGEVRGQTLLLTGRRIANGSAEILSMLCDFNRARSFHHFG